MYAHVSEVVTATRCVDEYRPVLEQMMSACNALCGGGGGGGGGSGGGSRDATMVSPASYDRVVVVVVEVIEHIVNVPIRQG